MYLNQTSFCNRGHFQDRHSSQHLDPIQT